MFKTDYLSAINLIHKTICAIIAIVFTCLYKKMGNLFSIFVQFLGCQPRSVRSYIETELADWQNLGVEGHFFRQKSVEKLSRILTDSTARLVGALPTEVVVMNALTTNLHLLMASFYRPNGRKYKIVIEADAFPSDAYAVESQLRLQGFDQMRA